MPSGESSSTAVLSSELPGYECDGDVFSSDDPSSSDDEQLSDNARRMSDEGRTSDIDDNLPLDDIGALLKSQTHLIRSKYL